MVCRKCKILTGFLVLVAGVLFLLQDLDVWTFWNLNWYTVVLLLMGIAALGMASCPDCRQFSPKVSHLHEVHARHRRRK